ncbi:MAG: UvrD-helicase domain-containing protein [Thermoanaerobacteraceae bacterium]|nr:UvrD-helicase domain-containing protein [Thermoanaerobacteraceae bacterium]
MEYTPEQQKAIEIVDKNLAVTAGAGAGKTRVLVARILYILRQGLADIDEIVAITYTNKAALEIRERLRQEMMKERKDSILSKNLRKLGTAYIGTIHSFCFRLLRENPVEADIDPDIKILEEFRANAWLKEGIERTVLDNLENTLVFQLTSKLGFSKLVRELYNTMINMQNQGIEPSVIEKMAVSDEEKTIALLICQSFKTYQLKKEKQLFLDYEDVLQKTFVMLKNNHEILQDYREKFKFIMIDEYQDLNFVQDKILRLLGEGTNLFVVGDKKQSIYGFRGARVELFESLKADLESRGQAIVLKDNFRSDRRIIEFVNRSFENLMTGYEPILANRCNVGDKNICFITPESTGTMDERRRIEGEFIAKKVLRMITDEAVKIYDKDIQKYRNPTFRDFAVLFRRKTHLKHYIRAFKKYNIPFHVADTGSLMESSGVKNLLYALKTIEFQDNISLYGALSHLFNISDNCLVEYVLTGRELASGIKEDAEYTGVSESLVKAFQLIRSWCKIKDKVTLRELAGTIVDETGLLSFLAQIDLLEVESLYKFLDLCWHYDRQGYTLKEFLEELADFGDEQQEATDASEEEDVVKFITIHSSKGLEFPIVFLADSGQDISFTSSDILFDPEIGFALREDKDKWEKLKQHLEQKEMEEAKRLLYVALTRARDYLVISGEVKSEKKESFLKWLNQDSTAVQEIPIDVIDQPSEVIVEKTKLPSLEKTKHCRAKTQIQPGRVPVLERYSITSLGEYARCPRRYYFGYVTGIPERIFYKNDGGIPKLSAMERGTIVHELIEKIHKDNIKEKNINELLNSLGYSLGFEDVNIIEKCIQNYIESDIITLKGEVFSEIPFTYRVSDWRLLTGKADLLVFEDDGATIVDFKTNTQIHSNLLDIYRLQVLAYALAISEIYSVKPKRVIIASLFEGKLIQVETSQTILLECKNSILSIINRIESGAFSDKASEQVTCDFCAYKNILCKLL